MGVAFKDIIPSKQVSIDDLSNKTLAVDTSNMLYQFLTSIRSRDGTPLQDSKVLTADGMPVFSLAASALKSEV